MNQPFTITSNRVLISGELHPASLTIENGVISEIRDYKDPSLSGRVEDYGDHIIMPGLIDAHVHINEPGRTEWEGFESATSAGAAGGITTLADMPLNCSPVTTSVEALNQKRQAAQHKSVVDCYFYGGLIPGNENQIESLINEGVPGIKTFLCHSGLDEFPNSGEKELQAAMPVLARYGKPLLVHAELIDDDIPDNKDPQSYADFVASRPPRWEVQAIEKLISLCRETGCHVHIVHLATAEALPLLQDARNEGLPVTVETAPHYLFFSAEQIPDGDTRFKCAPPIRSETNRNELWEAVSSGIIDMVATDHSPCLPKLKETGSGDFQKAWGGISSLQLLLPAMWTGARNRGFTPADVSRLLSKKPAQLLGLQESAVEISEGRDANITVWNPDNSFVVNPGNLFHRHSLTPYAGERLYGIIRATYLRGKKIFQAIESG